MARLEPFIHLLVFELGDQRFGIATADVKEIARAVAVARLPKAPPIVEGVINFRGAAIPVLDIRARFGLPPQPLDPADHLIVATAGRRIVALRVDRVTDTVTVAARDVEDVAAITAGADYVAGVAKLPSGLVVIHALPTFLSAAEASALDLSLADLMPA